MGRRIWTRECVPDDDITLDNYLVNLLREEDVIEAIRTVDFESAFEMSRKLEVDLQDPWNYIDEFDKTSDEERLEAFQRLKKEAEEIEKVSDKEGSEDTSLKENTCSTEKRSRKKRDARRSSNGTCTWSSRFYHIIQEDKNAAKDKQIAEQRLFNGYIKYRTKTAEHQFYEYNMKRKKDTFRKLPEELAYRPFDAVRAIAEFGSRENLLKMAARRIMIVVTQH